MGVIYLCDGKVNRYSLPAEVKTLVSLILKFAYSLHFFNISTHHLLSQLKEPKAKYVISNVCCIYISFNDKKFF